VTALGVSKDAADRLIETLVARDYLERSVDLADAPRPTVTLTERGRVAAAAARAAVERIDGALAVRVGVEDVARTRAALAP
jgi:DNA-binding MarR family transcriptional regulator